MRIGRAGTLDPAASGVLPVCVGQATRVAEYLSESGKAYRATLHFGIETDTYDAEGAVVRTSAGPFFGNGARPVLAQTRKRNSHCPPSSPPTCVHGRPWLMTT